MVTGERRREALELISTATEWAVGRDDILAVGLVGSWARDAARMEWARIDPVDDGTRRVVTDGMRVLYDPDGILAALNEAIDT